MVKTQKILRRLYLTIASVSVFFLSSAAAHAQLSCDAPLFATGFDKAPTIGSKAALIESVSRGDSIRIGWELDFDDDGVADLTHWADAAFLSIFEGEVFTQINAIHTQSPKRGKADIKMRSPYTEWRGSIGTTGVLEGKDSQNKSFPAEIKVATMWCSPQSVQVRPTLLYRHGPDGEPLAGSIEALLAAIREGQMLRIGWGFSRERKGQQIALEHLIEPVFVTAVDAEHVSAQLPEHIAQRAYHDVDNAFFDNPAVMWRGLMTTRGTFDAVWVDRATGKTVRRYPQRAALSWYALSAPVLDTPTLAVPGGVRPDETRKDEKMP